MNNISKYVSDKISESTYEKLNQLKEISFKYGKMSYFSKENIDRGQEGYRYNPLNDEIIEEWPDDNYVIIGIDNSVGDGGEPIMIKVDEAKLPIYHFENLDWNYPEIIADSLDDYIKINNKIFEYLSNLENYDESEFNTLSNYIKNVNNSPYWDDVLNNINI